MRRVLFLALVVVMLAGCSPIQVQTPSGSAPKGAGAVDDALTLDELKSATYSGIFDEPVTLTNGLFEGEPYVEGDASRPTVEYQAGAEQYGDLDGDGVKDAITFLVERGGGTGAFLYVAAQLNRDGQPVDAGAVRIEDRIQVRSATIEEGQAFLALVVGGAGDGACCATHKASKAYALLDGRLVETESIGPFDEQVSTLDLSGTLWRLVELGEGQPALDGVTATIQFDGSQISGTGGCNAYTSTFTESIDNPFVITIAPVTSANETCGEPAQSQEVAYSAALEKVSQWGYAYGDLALAYAREDGSRDRLLFAPATAADSMGALAAVKQLSAQPWQWVSFTSPVEQVQIDDPTRYQATFADDGTVAIVADCNEGIGGYRADDGAIDITVVQMTMAACGPDSRSEQFVTYLGSAVRYFFQDDQLFIDLFADGGTMQFSPKTQ